MKVYEFAVTRDRRALATTEMARIAQSGRRVRRKPRTPEERDVILGMAAAGMRRRLDSGRMRQTGPRSWEVVPRRTLVAVARSATSPMTIEQGDRD